MLQVPGRLWTPDPPTLLQLTARAQVTSAHRQRKGTHQALGLPMTWFCAGRGTSSCQGIQQQRSGLLELGARSSSRLQPLPCLS